MSTMEGLSPTNDTNNESSSNNSFVMIHAEQTDAATKSTTTSSILCTHCNSINPSSSQTCIKCSNLLYITTDTSTPQTPPTPPTEPTNAPITTLTTEPTNTSYSYEQKSDVHESDNASDNNDNNAPSNEPQFTMRYSQFSANNINALHLAPPTQQLYPLQEQLFGNFFFRTLYLSSTLILTNILSFHLWFSNKKHSTFQAAFAICATGTLLIFLGSICGIIYAVIHRANKTFKYLNIIQYITMALYWTGALIYWIGGCVLASAYNNLLSNVDHIHAFSGIWFCEITYISAHAVIAGVDIKKRYLNTHGLRVVFMSLILLCLSLIIFFCCAVWSVANRSKISGYGLQATGYFIIILLIPLFIGIKIIITPENRIQVQVDMLIAICLSVCVLFIMLGYFLLAADDNSGEIGQYWVGFGFFILFQGIFIVMDMSFEKLLPFKWADNMNINDGNDLEEYMLKKTPGSMY